MLPTGYAVSPCGIVYSLPRVQEVYNRWGKLMKRGLRGRVIKPWVDSRGKYLYVSLGRNCRTSVHRLVATTYLPNPDNLPQVNHKDGNHQNNNVVNLEWVTHKSNIQHLANLGGVGGPYGNQKLLPCEETDALLLEEYQRVGSFKRMDNFLGCNRTTISRYMQKRRLLDGK